MDIDPTIMQQLEEAQAALDSTAPIGGPPIAADSAMSAADPFSFSASGSDTAVHVLVDHYFANANAFLWRTNPAARS